MSANHKLHNHVFQLTLALYRVTDFFPQNEPLRKHLREKANDIFGGVMEFAAEDETVSGTLAKIQSIRASLAFARSLGFVRPVNLTVLEREYNLLYEDIYSAGRCFSYSPASSGSLPINSAVSSEPEPLPTWEEFSHPAAGVISPHPPETTTAVRGRQNPQVEGVRSDLEARGDLTSRQKTILQHLERAGHAKISDFYSMFTGISSKTIQRDLQDLVSKSVLTKAGEKRWTVYSLTDVL